MWHFRESGEQTENTNVDLPRHGVFLTYWRGKFVVVFRGEELIEYESDEFDVVFVQGFGITVNAKLQSKLAEIGVPVVIAPHEGRVPAVSRSVESAKTELRRRQAVRRDDRDVRKLARKIVEAKLANQAAVLKYFAKYRRKKNADTAARLERGAERIRRAERKASKVPVERNNFRSVLMGYEGQGASEYWEAFAVLVPEQYEFPGREGRGADDPPNAALNDLSALLYTEVWREVVTRGLDPYFGILHGSCRDSGSLVFDVIEVFRPAFVDRVLLAMFGRGFRPESRNDGTLRSSTCRKLVDGFERRWKSETSLREENMTPRELLEEQIADFAKFVQGGPEYRPLRFKW